MVATVLLLLLFLIALLAMPISLAFRAGWPDTEGGYVRVQWAFGLVRLQLPLSQEKRATPAGSVAAKKTKPQTKPKRRGSSGGPKVMALLRQRPFRQRLLRYLRDCWAAFHQRDVQLRMRIGLDDPADTGQLWAFMGPLAALLANARGATIELEPQFDEESFELEGSGRVGFIPLQLIYLTLALLLSPQLWQGLRRAA